MRPYHFLSLRTAWRRRMRITPFHIPSSLSSARPLAELFTFHSYISFKFMVVSILCSFLVGRNFTVNARDAFLQPASLWVSATKICTGSRLLLVHIHDIHQAVRVSIVIYADNVTHSCHNSEILHSTSEKSERWSEDLKLPVNHNKLVSTTLGRAGQNKCTANGAATLARIDQHKILGFWLGSPASFTHCH